LGDAGFVSWVKDTFLSTIEEKKEIPQLKKLKPKVSLKRILKAVCDEYGCSEGQIREKGRKRHQARELAIYLSRELSGAPCKDLGRFFGGVSGAAITMRYNQVAKETARNKRLRGKANKIKKQIFNI